MKKDGNKKVVTIQPLRLHSNKSMHTGCMKCILAPVCLGIDLQMQVNTSRNSGRLNCNFYSILKDHKKKYYLQMRKKWYNGEKLERRNVDEIYEDAGV